MSKHHELICPKNCPHLNKKVCKKYGEAELEESGWFKEHIKCFACRNQTDIGDIK